MRTVLWERGRTFGSLFAASARRNLERDMFGGKDKSIRMETGLYLAGIRLLSSDMHTVMIRSAAKNMRPTMSYTLTAAPSPRCNPQKPSFFHVFTNASGALRYTPICIVPSASSYFTHASASTNAAAGPVSARPEAASVSSRPRPGLRTSRPRMRPDHRTESPRPCSAVAVWRQVSALWSSSMAVSTTEQSEHLDL